MLGKLTSEVLEKLLAKNSQSLGDYLLYLNIQKITQDMANDKVAMLHLHHGFAIWIITILICFIIGIITTKIAKKHTFTSIKE